MNKRTNTPIRKISGWANTNFSYSETVFPETFEDVISTIKDTVKTGKKILPCGSGQSYGDQALNDSNVLVDMSNMNKILEWDSKNGLLKTQPGATYEKVLTHCLKDNWTLPVIPGTRYVSIGGALANNVHGKNSYNHGNFGEWVKEFKIVIASGECLSCSKENNSDLFFGAIGGAGLLGIVTEITLQLVSIPSPYLAVKKSTASNINEIFNTLDESEKKDEFAIAQIDCFPQGSPLGRGTVHSGSFVLNNDVLENIEEMKKISPLMFGVFPKKLIVAVGKYFLNNQTMCLVSTLKYYFDKLTSSKKHYKQNVVQFTFLLDNLPNWKKVFRYGFFEYEPLIPKEKVRTIVPQLISLTHKYGMPAYLSAIKIHRKDNFLLSYSMNGYSFAMDIPQNPKKKEKQNELFRKMNRIVISVGGIVYLAKDANLTAEEFREMYKVDDFLNLKKKYDPDEMFQSDMYRRIFKK